MKKCFIFGALPTERLVVKPTTDDFIIAADKGFLSLEKLNLTPDLIIGDFDSLGYEPDFPKKIVLPVKKDLTDTAVAINYALDNGYRNIVVYGAAEGKTDHTLANIALCANASRCGAQIVSFGENTHFTAVTDGSLKFNSATGRVSVFAFGGKAEGVTLSGFEYELNDYNLDEFTPLGVSNRFNGNVSTVAVKNGTLIVTWEDSEKPQW